MGQVVFRHDEKAGGVLVDAVDDTGPQDAVDAGQLASPGVEQAVDQGVLPVTRRRVNHQALGLVYDDDVLILVGDGQLHLGGLYVQRLRLRQLHPDDIPRGGFVILLHRFPIYGDDAAFQQGLGTAAAETLHRLRKKDVDPLPRDLTHKFHIISPIFSRPARTPGSRTPDVPEGRWRRR